MSAPISETDAERRFPRRFLLAASGTAAAAGLTQAIASPAEAAPGTTAWLLGGNAGVVGDGSNFLGPTTAAPLIIKTKASSSSPLQERMRVQASGLVGIGTTTPSTRLDVRGTPNGPVAFQAINPNTSGTAGVKGVCDAGTGVTGTSANNTGAAGTGGFIGLSGSGGSYGLVGSGTGTNSTGAYLTAAAYGAQAYGSIYGVYANGGDGVHAAGTTNGLYGTGPTGVYGITTSGGGTGISGHGGAVGVFGGDASNSGVRGDSTYVGVWGTGASWGLYGLGTATTGQNYGVYGATDSAAGFGVYCEGNAHVSGTLSKSAGSFKIDHPLAPERKWLSHSFVESPDMMNVYNGNVKLDAHGAATITLPSYFGALNHEFRYQLTPIGGPARDLHVAREVRANSFKIAGGTPNAKVSWQVTGIRKDDYATSHPIVVETDKTAAERGTRSFVPAGSLAKRFVSAPKAVPVPEHQRVHEEALPKPKLQRVRH